MAYNTALLKAEFKKVEEWLLKEFSQIHSGRATPIVLDGIHIDVYGSRQPLKNTASIHIEDPKTLRVAPWDKSQVKEIEKAILTANLGLSVATDDQGVRVIFPMLTTENRTKLVKILKEKLEDARISIRKEREQALTDLKNDDVSEDEIRRAKDEIQKCVDEANQNLEAIFEKKEKEVMQ